MFVVNHKRISFIFFSILFFSQLSFSYSGYVGQTISLPGPSAPGIIGAASWYSDNKSLSINGNAYGASVFISSYFNGEVRITCQYVYSYYVGTTRHYSSTQYAYYYVSCIPYSLSLNKKEINLQPGEEAELSYESSVGIDPPSLNWITSDKEIADFVEGPNTYGYKTITVYAKKEGQCIITCRGYTGEQDPTCKVVVKAIPPTAIKLSPEKLTLREGNQGSFTYEMTPKNASSKIEWSSSDESVATVSSSGKITALKQGLATITAKTSNGLSATGVVEVVPLPQRISFPGKVSLYREYMIDMKPEISPANAVTVLTWESSDSKTASVDARGRVRGIKEGSVDIKVTTDNGITATCKVDVVSPPHGLDYPSTKSRIKTLKSLFNKSMETIKSR